MKKSDDKIDWGKYFEDGRASLQKRLEEDPIMWNNWTNSDKRYMLITNINYVGNDFNNKYGTVTHYYDAHISSNSIETLLDIWDNFFSKRPYDTTRQHFIADMKEKKVVKFVSVCM